MLQRRNIRHGAMLRPGITKCVEVKHTGKHAYTKATNGQEQCISCGKIKPVKDN